MPTVKVLLLLSWMQFNLAFLCEQNPNFKCLTSCSRPENEVSGLGVLGCTPNTNLKCCDEATAVEETPVVISSQNPIAPSRAVDSCGVSPSPQITSRIFGGTDNLPCDWPWQVSIRGKPSSTTPYGQFVPLCGGVLIDEQWVVTTADCVLAATTVVGGTSREQNIEIIAGEHNTKYVDLDPNMNSNEEYFSITRIVIHPGYFKNDASLFTTSDLFNTQADENNIALLKLNKRATLTRCVRKVCLPEVDNSANVACPFKQKCWLAGWGLPSNASKLQEAEVEVVNSAAWNYINSFSDTPNTLKPLNTWGKFTEDGKNTCVGDSGGMVVCKNSDGNWSLEGLINAPGFKNCEGAVNRRVRLIDIRSARLWMNSVISP